ncbi:MAG: metallophosphoesterase [Candidatus Aegiribacteria sp.]|nr:metallophosphoesterase [Candidatus Aegiribacteria sp.]
MISMLLILSVSFPVRIAVLGDRTGRPDDAEFEIAVSAIIEMSPDIVLSVGDFVEGNGDVETLVEDWENMLPVLQRLTNVFPFVYTPGNNDIWNEETAELWRQYTGTEPSRIEDILGITFVVWNSSMESEFTAENLETINDLVDGIDTDNPWIFVTHKPFWFMAWQDSAAVSEFKGKMEETGPLAVVGGHIHLLAAQRENGILYISAGSSGSAVPEPEPERGYFTQLGWMTVWHDSVAFAVVDARGIYSENINTGEEMNLAYLYEEQLISARPLEQELESAILTLTPQENRPRRVTLDINPGTWNLRPGTLEIEIYEEPVELVFTQSPEGSPYPSPAITVILEYGSRDKQLQFDYSWQVLRTAEAFYSEPVLDGEGSDGEYRVPFHTNFADLSGQPTPLPETVFAAATDEERLFIIMKMVDCTEETEEYGGFIFNSLDGSILWLKVFRDGSSEALIFTSEGELIDWEDGFDTVVNVEDGRWCLELAVDIDLLYLVDDFASVHMYRSAGEDFGTWVYPIDFDPSSMGKIWLQCPVDPR